MADKPKDLTGLFVSNRSRVMLVVVGIIAVIAIIMGISFLRGHQKSVAGNASLSGTPNVRSVPGGFGTPPTAQYVKLQKEQNVAEAQQAVRTGTSAVPTITSSSAFGTDEVGACVAPGTLPPGALGVMFPDGTIRNAQGHIVARLGADGIWRNAQGNPFGPQGKVGHLVYGADGHLIGIAGPDGVVRDLNGNIMGHVGADGKVYGPNGQLLGTVSNIPVGALAYGPDGKVTGVIGPDGKVRNAAGQVIGSVGPDSVVRDLNGKINGNASDVVPGEVLRDKNGKISGVVGADGVVRNADGQGIGTVNSNGEVHSLNGKLLGAISHESTKRQEGSKSAAGGATSSATQEQQALEAAITAATQNKEVAASQSTEQLEAAAARREALITADQRTQQMVQRLQASMAAQANQLFTAWGPSQQTLVEGVSTNTNQSGAAGSKQGGGGGAGINTLIKAGTIMFATLDTAVNSDQPGPILATIVSGPYKGTKLIGVLTNQGEKVMLSFRQMNVPEFSRVLSISAVAIDPETARTALSSYTDNHYLLRYGTLFASAFASGYGQALSQSGAMISTTGLSTSTSMPSLSAKDKFILALGNVGTKYSSVLGNVFNTPPTVHVYSGTSLGILFTADVSSPPGETVPSMPQEDGNTHNSSTGGM